MKDPEYRVFLWLARFESGGLQYSCSTRITFVFFIFANTFTRFFARYWNKASNMFPRKWKSILCCHVTIEKTFWFWMFRISVFRIKTSIYPDFYFSLGALELSPVWLCHFWTGVSFVHALLWNASGPPCQIGWRWSVREWWRCFKLNFLIYLLCGILAL